MRHLLDVNPVAVRHFADTELNCTQPSPPRNTGKHTHSTVTHATHTYAALVFHTAGEATFEQNGLWHVKAGDMMLIPAGQTHRRVSTHETEYWGMGICMPCFGSDEGLALLNPFERVRNGASAIASIAPERRAYTVGLFRELAAQSQNLKKTNQAVQRSLVTLILNEIESARSGLDRATTLESGVVGAALHFIENNCLKPLTLVEVARAVGRSAAHVTTALSQATGKSVVEWIVAYRIAEARSLLIHSDERVSAVAERVGYSDTTHFIRMFRRATGLTPSAFRAASKKPTALPTRG